MMDEQDRYQIVKKERFDIPLDSNPIDAVAR